MAAGEVCARARHDYPKSDRVRTRKEIQRIFDVGTRFSCKGMRLHVLPNGRERSRVVIVPLRSYASAVTRNRAKRVVRECWRLGKERRRGTASDCVVVLYPGTDTLRERSAQLDRLLRQAGLITLA